MMKRLVLVVALIHAASCEKAEPRVGSTAQFLPPQLRFPDYRQNSVEAGLVEATRSMLQTPIPAFMHNSMQNPLMFNLYAPNPMMAATVANNYLLHGPPGMPGMQDSRMYALPRGSRPSAPSFAPPPSSEQGKAEQSAATGRKDLADSQAAHLQTSSTAGSTLLGGLSLGTFSTSGLTSSLTSGATTALSQAHSLFEPPYSWMWRVGIDSASLKYPEVAKVADVPELLSLITGYYAGTPEAKKAADAAANPTTDPYSLLNLAETMAGITPPTPAAPGKGLPDGVAAAAQQAFASYMGGGGGGGSNMAGKKTPGANQQFAQHAQKNSAESGGFLAGLFGGSSPNANSGRSHTPLSTDSSDEDAFFMNDGMNAESEGFFSQMFGGGAGTHSAKPSQARKPAPASAQQGEQGVLDSFMKTFGSASSNAAQKPASWQSHSAPATSSGGGMADMMSTLASAAMGSGGTGGGMAQQMMKMAGPALMQQMMGGGGKAAAHGGGGGGGMAEQMLKMAAPSLGIDPAMASMAAPLVSSFL